MRNLLVIFLVAAAAATRLQQLMTNLDTFILLVMDLYVFNGPFYNQSHFHHKSCTKRYYVLLVCATKSVGTTHSLPPAIPMIFIKT